MNLGKTTRTIAIQVAILLGCLAILLALDFIYSAMTMPSPGPAMRIAHREYHHGFAANVATMQRWGNAEVPYFTNSLGLRDAAIREIPLRPTAHRILLLGDSFTEGLGVPYEDSFAGMLAKAGLDRAEKIEFLNAGVSSYSPVIYYRKTKYLIENGLHFDEVVVLPDVSDVRDEATSYFCIDEDPRYRGHCGRYDGFTDSAFRRDLRNRLRFTMRAVDELERRLVRWFGPRAKERIAREIATDGWMTPGFEERQFFSPLGLQGGVARALQNMNALADLLARRNIPLTIVVFPGPFHLMRNHRDNPPQVKLWRDFCLNRCKAFFDLSPAFFVEKDAHPDWLKRLFIPGDVHYSEAGNRLVFRELSKHLLRD